MLEEDKPVPTLAAEPMPWHTAWITALTKPTVVEYEALVAQPAVSTTTASLWVFIAATIGYIISILFLMLIPSSSTLSPQSYLDVSSLLGIGALSLCLSPISGLISVLGLYINAGISHLVARALGGMGTFSQLTYAIAAYTSPISIIASLLGMIPFLNCLLFPIGIYAICLNVLSIKAVHKFSWGRAIGSSVLFVTILFFLVACLVIVILALLGPAIGSVFSNIINEIGTPVP